VEKRLIIAVVLSLSVLFLWNVVFKPPQKPQIPQEQQEEAQAEKKIVERQGTPDKASADLGESVTLAPNMLPSLKEEKAAVAEKIPSELQADKNQGTLEENKQPEALKAVEEKTYVRPAEELVVIETEDFRAIFTSYGAALKSFVLKAEQFASEDKDTDELIPLDLIKASEEESLPYRLFFDRANFTYEKNPTFAVKQKDKSSVVFALTTPEGVTIEKEFKHTEKYMFDLNVRIINNARGNVTEAPYVSMTTFQDDSELQGGVFGSAPLNQQIAKAYVDNEVWEESDKDNLQNTVIVKGRVLWAGIDDRYFFMALLPPEDAHSQIDAKTIGNAKGEDEKSGRQWLRMTHSLPQDNILAGTSKEYEYKIYVGTKSYSILADAGYKLDEAVDFWHLGILAKPMLWVLKHSYTVVRNWGVAIIILTLLIKILLFPLTQKSFKSMQRMKDLKPKLDALKEKNKDDKNELNRQMMEMYKREGVNPMGGCLPMLLQMPVYIALYQMLRNAVELYNAPFIPGWIDNLVQPDPYYILPTILAIVMFIQQKMTPNPDSQQQKMMMYMMPAMMFFFMLVLPSGLVLYIFSNSLLTIGQQWLISRKSKPVKA